jgi:hypothetical protein
MYVLIYVDDLIIVNSSSSATTHLLHQLDVEFSIKDLSNLHYFLGIEVCPSADGLILSQKKYITDLLHKTHMTHCRPVSTRMSSSEMYLGVIALLFQLLRPPFFEAQWVQFNTL